MISYRIAAHHYDALSSYYYPMKVSKPGYITWFDREGIEFGTDRANSKRLAMGFRIRRPSSVWRLIHTSTIRVVCDVSSYRYHTHPVTKKFGYEIDDFIRFRITQLR